VLEGLRDLQYQHVGSRTSLGEEGAEAMVVVLGLALLSEVAVGLDAVLEAVELVAALACFLEGGQGTRWLPPPFRTVGDGEVQTSTNAAGRERTSQQELAIWQPAWPTTRVQC
jgi:hypothetical protein